jgi:glutamyl-tRNA synthetase
VAFLGWNPGDEREIFTLDELVNEFSLERVGKAGAVFNVEKLNWMNFEYLRKKSDADVLTMLKDHLKATKFSAHHFDDAFLLNVIFAMRERASFVKDFVEKSSYFFEAPTEYDPEVVKKRWKPESANLLEGLSSEFRRLENPKKEDYETALHRVAETSKVKNADLIHPLRLAVSGVGGGPGLYDILSIVGRDETVRRIASAIEKLK